MPLGSAAVVLRTFVLQEFLAFGFMNFLGSLFGAIPTSGNFSRTLLQLSFGGNTQVSVFGMFDSERMG